MSERAQRVMEECALIAAMSEEPERITRRFLTPPVAAVHAYLRERMEDLGMNVRVDAAGNLRAVWRPNGTGSSQLMLGSHIDTVPNAGRFDGVLGVVMAIEWVRIAQKLALTVPIEVIAFSEEEGVRFGVPFIGSRAVAGRFDRSLLQRKDANGVTLDDALRSFGLDPGRIDEAALDDTVAAFVEIHIEQGPVLEAEKLSLGVVNGIVGQSRLNVEFTGHANHAGTTPMNLRQDALATAAEWIVEVESMARATDGLVATVGKIIVDPNAGNVIPGCVKASLDVRHLHDFVRRSAVEQLLDKANAIAERRGLTVHQERQLDQPAVPMDERLSTFLADAIEAIGLPVKHMPSGAGHDAMLMAARVPTAMLFLRSPGGISHHPDESVLEQDVEAALQAGGKFLERFAAVIG